MGHTGADAMAAASGSDENEAIGPRETLDQLMKCGRLFVRLRENRGEAGLVGSQPREIGKVRRDHGTGRKH